MRNITADHKISVLKNLTDRFKTVQFKRFTDAGANKPEKQSDADVLDAVLTAADASVRALSEGVLEPIFDVIMDNGTREEIRIELSRLGYECADIPEDSVAALQQDLLGAVLPPVLVLYLQQVIPYALRASISGLLATERVRAEHFLETPEGGDEPRAVTLLSQILAEAVDGAVQKATDKILSEMPNVRAFEAENIEELYELVDQFPPEVRAEMMERIKQFEKARRDRA